MRRRYEGATIPFPKEAVMRETKVFLPEVELPRFLCNILVDLANPFSVGVERAEEFVARGREGS